MLEGLESAPEAELEPLLAYLAARDLDVGEDELRGAVRRAVFVLAAGGDPHRSLALDSPAVTTLADDLGTPTRRAALATGVAELAAVAPPRVRAALEGLGDRAWNAYAAALLADEIGAD